MQQFSWQAPEFEHWEKPRVWYLGLILVTALICIIALWQGNFLFAVFAVLAAFVLVSSGRHKPRVIEMRLTENELIVDGAKSYTHDQLSGFAVHRLDMSDDGFSELIIQKKHKLGGYMKFLYPTAHTTDIRHFLNNHLPEIEYEESLSDHLARWLRI